MPKYAIILRGIKTTYSVEVEADDIVQSTDWMRLNNGNETVFTAPKDSVVYVNAVK